MSAVIPVYNGADFIGEAIGSVLGQSYPRVECVVVDDGSTDETPDVVRGFGDAVRYVRKPNGGVASARNRGVAAAEGEYVAFLDADDVWLPHKLERQMELFRRRPELGLVHSGVYMVDRSLNRLAELRPPAPRVALRNSLLMELPVMMTSMTAVLPVAVFRATGGYDERLSTSADTDFACRVASSYPVDCVDEPLALYRQHGAQMHLSPRAMERDMLLVLEKFFAQEGRPADLLKLRNRAYANLHMGLAAAYFHQGDKRSFFRYLARALRHHPARSLSLLWKRISQGGQEKRVAVGYS